MGLRAAWAMFIAVKGVCSVSLSGAVSDLIVTV
jgi:hypothetical protein